MGWTCQAQLGWEETDPPTSSPSPARSLPCLFQVPQQSPGQGPENSLRDTRPQVPAEMGGLSAWSGGGGGGAWYSRALRVSAERAPL